MPQSFAAAVRDAFESRYVASPGLENRVLGAIPWERPAASRAPRLAVPFAAALAGLVIVLLAVPLALARLGISVPGLTGESGTVHAYSLAAVSGETLFVVQRDISLGPQAHPAADHNFLLESTDGGRTWHDRLHFDGVFIESGAFGAAGYVASIDMQPVNCQPSRLQRGQSSTCSPASYALHVYRTSDAGLTWTALPATEFPVQDVFFIDDNRGWAVSTSPTTRNRPDQLYATVDGGASWTRVGDLPDSRPNGWAFASGRYMLTFTSPTRGWWDGGQQLFTTADGGRTWAPVAVTAPPELSGWTMSVAQQPVFSGSEGVLVLAFRDPSGGPNAARNRLLVYASHDGGAAWGDPHLGPAGFEPVGDIVGAVVLDPRHVWLTSLSQTGGANVQAKPAIARTSDGGASWSVVKDTPRILNMVFSDPQRGYGVDVRGPQNTNGIVRTADGGATWQPVPLPVFGDR